VVVDELLASSAKLFALAGALPQVRRLTHRGDLAGVSLVGPMIGVASESTWIAYTLDAGLWSAAMEPVFMIAAHAALLRAARRAGGALRWASGAATAWLANLGEAVLWTSYGVAKRDHALVLLGIVEFGASAAILVRIATRRPSAALVPPRDRGGCPSPLATRQPGSLCR
jgi:hypothetical protein